MKSIAVIDYGMGNLHSVAKALEHVCPDTRVYVTNDAAKIEACDRVVLPGVGAIQSCMAEIKRLGVDQIVADQMGKKPMLGICVGMQALMQRSSENGGVDCLGQLPGDVAFFWRPAKCATSTLESASHGLEPCQTNASQVMARHRR